jgi:hypothetical protein
MARFHSEHSNILREGELPHPQNKISAYSGNRIYAATSRYPSDIRIPRKR